jgi:large subunit ribosomal protein L25
MAQIELTAESRPAERHKGGVRALRRSGFVPGIVYHKGDRSVPLKVPKDAVNRILHTEAGRNVLIDLKIKDEKAKKQRTVVVKDLQHDPVTGDILHIDFHQISLTERITVNVPIVEKGEAPGVKNEGGVLESPLKELHIECLPTEIPEHVEVDVSGLKLNDAIHVRDLALPGSVKVLNDPEMVIAQVRLPVVEKPEEAAAAEVTEPEVIGEKKEEAEGEAAPPEAKKEKAEKPEKTEKGAGEPKK